MTTDIDFQIESYNWLIGFRGEPFVKALETTVAAEGVEAAERLAIDPNMPPDMQECHCAAIQHIAKAASPPAELARKG